MQYFAGNRCEVAASTPPSSPRATKTEAKADKDAKELAEYRRVKKMLGVLPSEDGSVVLKPLESIAPLVLRELSEHDKDYLTRSPPVLRATPTVPRKTGGPGEAPVFKRAAAAQMNIECCRSPQLVLGHPHCVPAWKKIASDLTFDFRTVATAAVEADRMLFRFFIRIFIISVTQPKVEGWYNKFDLYGDTQLDPHRKEGWLQVHDVEFEPGREARRDPSMRVKPGSEESLQGHAESLTQLEEYGLDLMRRMHQEGEDTDLWNTALSEWRKEAAARKEARRRAGKTSDACMFCNQGGVLMMCEYDTCPHAAHLQCTGLSEDPDEWVCNMCKNKHK